MAKTLRIGEVVHLFSLSVWFGCLVATGVAAGILFPTIRDLAPTSAAFAQYPDDHWLIIAGHVGAKLFAFSDFIQLVCAALALLTFGLALAKLRKQPGVRPWSMLARAVIMTVAIGLVSYELFILAPRMQLSLHSFWEAAKAGNTAEANRFREAFDQDHPIASSVMGATTVTVLIGWFFSAFNLAGMGAPSGCGGNCACKRKSDAKLEEPALISGTRP